MKKTKGIPEAIVDITSFRGISAGAVHYYGSLNINEGDHERIQLYRSVTQEDIDKYPDRFYGYEIGDSTSCFNTWRDVVVAAGEKAKENGINLDEVVVDGIPNTSRVSYSRALEPIDTRPKCKSCGKVIEPREGCYNTPSGIFCVKCYPLKYKKKEV